MNKISALQKHLTQENIEKKISLHSPFFIYLITFAARRTRLRR